MELGNLYIKVDPNRDANSSKLSISRKISVITTKIPTIFNSLFITNFITPTTRWSPKSSAVLYTFYN